MKKFLIISGLVGLFIFSMCTDSEETKKGYPISSIEQSKVELKEGFWKEKVSLVRETTIPYGFQKSEEKGRFDNFLIAAEKKEGPVKGKMPFDDSDPYKIIEGASYALMNKDKPELKAYLDSVISLISMGQEQDGYLTTWKTIDPQNPPASWCPPGGRWENLNVSHELYNAGHLYHAAAAHYKATGDTSLLSIAKKNAELIMKVFGPGKKEIPPGHQIIETGLIKLYKITGNTDYIEHAQFFLEQRGDSTTHDLYGAYSQDHKPVLEQEEAVGHAVRAVYMYEAMTDIAALNEDSRYRKSVQDLWKNVVSKKLYITGGIGAKHEGESFGDNYELPNLTAYAETCAAIGLVMWNYKMFKLTGKAKYIDVLERSLYNGLISGLSLEGTEFFYPNALESDSSYKFNRGALTRKEWFDCSCCPTNLMRFIPSIQKYIYAKEDNSIYVNLFANNQSSIEIQGSEVDISQKTNYPWKGKISINVNPEQSTRFALKIRIPGWARNQPVPGDLYQYKHKSDQKPEITINGEKMDYSGENGYISIDRDWKKGDQVTINFSMPVRKVLANDKVKADRNKIAFEKGPLVYSAEEVDNEKSVLDYRVDSEISFDSQYKSDMLGGINVITTQLPVVEKDKEQSKEYDFKAIPYFSWSNRIPGEMRVWFPKINSEIE